MPVNYIPHPIQANSRDELGARAYGVTYQNLNLRPFLVLCTSQHTVGNAANQARCYAEIGAAAPPGNILAYCGHLNPPGLGILHGFLAFLVPAGWFYRVISLAGAGNGNALNEWWEVDL